MSPLRLLCCTKWFGQSKGRNERKGTARKEPTCASTEILSENGSRRMKTWLLFCNKQTDLLQKHVHLHFFLLLLLFSARYISLSATEQWLENSNHRTWNALVPRAAQVSICTEWKPLFTPRSSGDWLLGSFCPAPTRGLRFALRHVTVTNSMRLNYCKCSTGFRTPDTLDHTLVRIRSVRESCGDLPEPGGTEPAEIWYWPWLRFFLIQWH